MPDFIELLGGPQVIDKNISSDFDLIDLCNQGLPKASLDVLSTYIGISSIDFLEKVLDDRPKAFEHRRNHENFNRRTSSHIIEIAKIIEHAYDVFEDEHKVKSWLNYASTALNYTTPFELFGTFTGIKVVDDILGRIEHGVFS